MTDFHRCIICNSTSSNEIAENHEKVVWGRYYYDREADGFLCHECKDSVDDAMYDFYDEDEEEEIEDE